MTLLVTNLSGFGAAEFAPPVVATKTFRNTDQQFTTASSYTHGAITVDIADTYAVVCIGSFGNGAGRSISSITVTGNNSGAHTGSVKRTSSTGDKQVAYIATAPISGDTSVTVSITYSGSCFGSYIAIYSGQNMSQTASATGVDETHSYSSTGTLTPENGCGFACVYADGGATFTWGNYTRDFQTGSALNRAFSVASTTSSTGPTCSQNSASTVGGMVVATFAAE